MKIYKISQSINWGYDTYDSAIVIAKNETEARKISPDDYRQWSDKEETWMFLYANGDIERVEDFHTWVNKLEHIKVELIGTATKDSKSGLVLASFNAG